MNRLHDLYTEQGQSPWLDNLRRSWIASGELQRWVDRGARGITSNPSIFQKAMTGTDAYDEQLRSLTESGCSVEESYWELVIRDIHDALEILRPVYEESDGLDGYVSVEVDPRLAPDTDGTMTAARQLNERLDRPNLYVKIPGTAEGIPAIRQMISEGRSINVTLIFSLDSYSDVMEAYISGLESCPGDLSAVSSVASFFITTRVSRHRVPFSIGPSVSISTFVIFSMRSASFGMSEKTEKTRLTGAATSWSMATRMKGSLLRDPRRSNPTRLRNLPGHGLCKSGCDTRSCSGSVGLQAAPEPHKLQVFGRG